MLWKTNQDFQQVIDLTHSKTPLGHNPYYQPTECQVQSLCTKIDISCNSVSEPADAMQVHELPAVVPQPQPVREMCHV